jgi:hypothetical protein
MRCLEVDPQLRFATAQDLSAALAVASDGSRAQFALAPGTGSRRLAQRLPSSTLLPLSPGALAVLAIVALLSLFVAASRFPQLKDKAEALWSRFTGGESPNVSPGATVFLTSIDNLTGDSQLDGVTELLRSPLGQSAHFNLMSPSRVCEVLKNMRKLQDTTKPCDPKLDPATAREVAMRDGVPRVVFGTLSKVSEDYVLTLDIEKPDTEPSHRRRHWTQSFSARSKNDLFDCIRDASDWARKTVGEARKEIDASSRSLQDITTDSWEALELYDKAEQLQRENRNPKPNSDKEDDNHADAVSVLHQAVEKDPHFALAYMRIADILFATDRYAEGLEAYQKALNTLVDQRLSMKEELWIKGLYALDIYDFPSALKTFESYSSLYPYDYRGYFYRARPFMALGQTEASMEMLLEAERLAPEEYYMPYHLAKYSLIDEHSDESASNTHTGSGNSRRTPRDPRSAMRMPSMGRVSFSRGSTIRRSGCFTTYMKPWMIP